MPEVVIRLMQPADVVRAEALSAESYAVAERFEAPSTAAGPPTAAADRSRRWVERVDHLLRTDPGGSWVAEHDGQMAGATVSLRRDLTWILSSFFVRPDLIVSGVGRPLLEATMTHARGCLRGMLCSSSDPRAVRRYRLAGFSLHPQLHLGGVVDRSLLPVVKHVRDGAPGDIDLLDSLDRQRRDAAHGADHHLLMAHHRLLVVDHRTGSGYAYLDADGRPVLLAAGNRRTAGRLLWACLAYAPADAPTSIPHVTPANEWALDVGLQAGLSVSTRGFLALRGMRPPAPYLPHGALL